MKHTIVFKKLSAILVVFILLLSMIPMTAFAVEETGIVTVDEAVADKAKELLVGLDMLSEGQQDYSKSIARGDFAMLLAGLMRYSGFVTPETGYRDIEGNPNAAAIGFAVEQGYMEGANGLFRPLDPVTVSEAARAFVELTGNNHYRNIKTVSAYTMKASGLGTFKTMDVSRGDDFVSIGAAYKMATNIFSAPSAKMSGIGGDYVIKTVSGNFLEVMHEIKKVSGVLTKTRYAGLNSSSGTGKSAIEIDQIRFAAQEDWTELLGCRVQAYIDCGGVDAEVLHLVPLYTEEIVKLKAENIISINSGKTELVYSLNEEEDDETIGLNNATTVIWNGTFGGSLSNFSVNQLSLRSDEGYPKTGYVRLIDNNQDGVCDVMIIMSYETYFTASADARKAWIVDTNREDKFFDMSVYRQSDRFVTYESGTAADVELLQKQQLIHVAEGINNQMLTVVIGETEIEATISQIRNRNGITEYYSDGVWYAGNDYFNKYYLTGSDQVYVGWHGYFNLDLDGRIATAEADSESYWGYLVAISQGSGISVDRQMKVFSNYNTSADAYEIQILDLASRVQVDAGMGSNQTYKEEDVASLSVFRRNHPTDAAFNAENNGFNDQLIQFNVNKQNEVTTIKTAYTGQAWDYDDFNGGRTPSDYPSHPSMSQDWFIEQTDFNLCYNATKNLSAADVKTQSKTLSISAPQPYNTELIVGGLVSLNENDVPIWVIPGDLNDDKSYNHCTWSTYGGSKEDIKIYDLKSDGTASAIVWRQPSGAQQSYVYESWQKVFVTDVKKVLNEEGVVATEVTGYRNTRYSSEKMGIVTLTSKDADMFNDVKIGDLIDYAVDSNKNVISIRWLFSYENFINGGKSSDYQWQHVDQGTDPTKDDPYGYDYANTASATYKGEEGVHWIRAVRQEPYEGPMTHTAWGYGAPFWGKILYDNTMGVTLTFDNPYETALNGNPTKKEDYGDNHQTFAKTNYFQWIVHDTITGETWLETSPAVYSVLDVGLDNVENATDVLAYGNTSGINMGVIYLK